MKQRLKSLKISSKLLIAAAVVAAIVIVIFGFIAFGTKGTKSKELEALTQTTKEVGKEFTDKYKNKSDVDAATQRDNLLRWLRNLFNNETDYSFKSKKEIIEILEGYPSSSEDIIIRDDIFSVVFGSAQYGLNTLNNFVSNCRLGIPGTMVMAQFTANLDPIYYYIEFDGNSYHMLEDQTRDGYDDETGFIEVFGKYLKFEGYSDQEGGIVEYGYITDDIKMAYKDVINYYATVDTVGPENMTRPECFEFYMGVVSKDELEKRILPPDRLSDEFTSEYNGYLDLHPSYLYDNPMADYDNDGIYDRIFRHFEKVDETRSETDVYCFMGDGNNILLAKNAWGEKYKTYSIDINNDGYKDIVFVQYTDEIIDSKSEAAAFLYENGNFVLSKLPATEYSSVTDGINSDGSACLLCTSQADGNSSTQRLYVRNGNWIAETVEASGNENVAGELDDETID